MVQESTKLEKEHDSESRKVLCVNFFPLDFKVFSSTIID